MEIIDEVNDNDEVVGQVSRQEAHDKKLTHRIAHVFIFNDRGEMAMQLRSSEVEFAPNSWITAGSGHVVAGKTYAEGAAAELQEEAGIGNVPLEFMGKDEYVSDRGKLFLGVFRCQHNGPFVPSPKEVAKIDFFSLDEIGKMISRGEKFHPEFRFLLEKHYNIK